VTIGFSDSDATPLTTECSFDGAAKGPCTGATSEALTGLAAGSHSLAVRATDSAGNSTTVTRHFAVNLPAAPAGNTGGSSGGSPGVLGAGPTQGAVANAKLTSKFRLKGKTTLVSKLSLNGLPSGAAVKVKCHGHGCPFKSRSLTAKNGSVSLAGLFKHKKLGKGTTIEIEVAVPGSPAQMFKVTTRAKKQPRISRP
jgi:hypothetical protein